MTVSAKELAIGLLLAGAGCKSDVPHPAAPSPPVALAADAPQSPDPCGGLAPGSCGEKASEYLTRSPADERGALPLLEAACARRDAESCRNLGSVRSNSADRDVHDERRAVEAFAKGCELGNYAACCDGGGIHENGSTMGPAVAKDFAAAAPLYRAGCEHGKELCCIALGNLYVVGGPGLPKNKKSAAEYYRKAHKLGYREDRDGD
jgi:TPR repeat protein